MNSLFTKLAEAGEAALGAIVGLGLLIVVGPFLLHLTGLLLLLILGAPLWVVVALLFGLH